MSHIHENVTGLGDEAVFRMNTDLHVGLQSYINMWLFLNGYKVSLSWSVRGLQELFAAHPVPPSFISSDKVKDVTCFYFKEPCVVT